MKDENLNDLIANGVGDSAGGNYKNVLINGVKNIRGNIECSDFKCIGVTSVYGNLKSDDVMIDGVSTIKGGVECIDLSVEGTAHVDKSIKAENVELTGVLKVDGDLTSESFISQGYFSIGGLLNAGTIDINIYGKCRAKEIGGQSINVKEIKKHFLKKVFETFISSQKLIVNTIEGDDIYLENTEAKAVRGNNIKIGPDCNIELVEYKDQFEKVNNTIVKETKKI